MPSHSTDNSTDNSSDSTDLGPRPEPVIEPGEPNPGGTDAVDQADGVGAADSPPLTRDLTPEDNPAVDDALPEEMTEPDDTSTEATKDDDAGQAADETEAESPA